MTIYNSPEAVELIKHFESCRLHSYVLSGENQATIGWGQAIPLSQHPRIITQLQADVMLNSAIQLRDAYLNNLIPEWAAVKLTNDQKAALMSFVYNIAFKNFEGKAAYNYLKSGEIKLAVPRLMLYTNGGSPGLVRRRKCENYLLTGGTFKELKNKFRFFQ